MGIDNQREKLSILIICLKLSNRGGNFVHVTNIIEGLKQKGHKITLITSQIKRNSHEDELFFNTLNNLCDNLYILKGRYNYILIFKTVALIRFLNKKEHFSIFHSINIISNLSTYFSGIIHGHVISLEGDLFPQNYSIIRKFIINIFFRIILRKVDSVISLGKNLTWQFIGRFPEIQNKITTIYSGINETHISSLSEIPILSPTKDLINCAYVGGLLTTKGIEDIIEFAEQTQNNVRSINIHIYGGGPFEKKIVKKTKHLQNLYYHGHILNKVDIFSSFNILLFPSFSEGLPWTILEAMAAGKLVISRDVGCISNVIENKKNGFVLPYSKSFTQNCLAVLNSAYVTNPQNFTKICKNARQNILDNFTSEREIEEIYNLYSNLAKEIHNNTTLK